MTRAGCRLFRWMLKPVPVWGGEWGRWPCRPLDDTAENVLSVGRGRIRDGMPVLTACVGDATPTYERRQDWFAMGATGQEHRPQPGPNIPHRTGTGTRFSIPGGSVPARSSEPRSDKDRSRNLIVTRKPKRNTPHGQKDPQSKPHA